MPLVYIKVLNKTNQSDIISNMAKKMLNNEVELKRQMSIQILLIPVWKCVPTKQFIIIHKQVYKSYVNS